MVSEFSGPGASVVGSVFNLGRVDQLHRELGRGNPNLIWGWKRDVGPNSRMIYFGGELEAAGECVVLRRWYLFYRHRADAEAITRIRETLESSPELRPHIRVLATRPAGADLLDLRLELGFASSADRDRVRRLQLRRPRRRFPEIVMPPAVPLALAARTLPADIYIGSGMSYEAGLPTLCDMHLAFGVDSVDCTRFATGDDDLLPERLATDLAGAIASFCSVHVGALKAPPTPAMESLAQLKASGQIRKVFTDNVDNMLAKVGVSFERTRGSGVFNERYPAHFASERLIVVGVAADRRSIVQQARAQGLEIVVVNPCEKVAPMVRHLDYIRPADLFFQVPAASFFAAVAKHGDTGPVQDVAA